LARQCCDPQDLDTFILPMIGDIQFELTSSGHRPLLARTWIRLRGYTAFFHGLALTIVLRQGRSPMHSKALGWLRLLLTIPAALAASFIVQYGAGELFGRFLVHPGPGGVAEGIWLVKVITTPLMAAAFFWTMFHVAPPERRKAVALGALVVVAAWGTVLAAAGVTSASGFHGSLFAMGIGAWAGGLLSYWSTGLATSAAVQA
jgi:hypothetical protein